MEKRTLSIDLLVGLLVSLFPWGWELLGFGRNFWVGLVCWGVCLPIVVSILFWKLPGTKHFKSRAKILASVAFCAVVVVVSWKPLRDRYHAPSDESPQIPPAVKRNANVSLEFIGPVNNPVVGMALQMWCVNDSDFPAYDEHCLSGLAMVKLVKGEVPQEDEEKFFEQFEKNVQLHPPKSQGRTLDPHQHSGGGDCARTV